MPRKRGWTRKVTWPRVFLLFILAVVVCVWYTLHDNLDLLNNDLYYNDPSFVHQKEDNSLVGDDSLKEAVVHFTVIPPVVEKTQTPAPPLVETDVIPDGESFKSRLRTALTSFGTSPVLLIVVDYGFMDMTVNFIKTSLDPLDLEKQLLIISLDNAAFDILENLGHRCVLLDLNKKVNLQASDFGTEGYYTKTNIKTWVVLQTLKLGHTVLISDVDIAIFKNPFPYFTCSGCDVHIQMDRELYNSGFVYVRPTHGSVAIYDTAWQYYLQYHTGHDQAYINMAITFLKKNNTVKIESLSWKQFPCGAYYFASAYRHFYNKPDCKDCVMAHNNYMGTTAGKVYRFKENLMWNIDREGYYSNVDTKYITYENPYDFGKDTVDMETNALLNALIVANLTNRVLVLPSFRCCNCGHKTCDHPSHRCSLLSVANIKIFHKTFGDKYREHSFLNNSAVPNFTKKSLSPIIFINNSRHDLGTFKDISKYVFSPEYEKSLQTYYSNEQSISSDTIMSIYERFSSFFVLRLHSTYDYDFDNVKLNGVPLKELYRTAIECSEYEQWPESLARKFFG